MNSDLSFDEQRLETLPAYELVARIRAGTTASQCVHLGVKDTGFDLYLERGIVLHYDLEGRLLRAAAPPLQWRRGLSHRTIELHRLPREQGVGFTARVLETSEADAILERFSSLVAPLVESVRAGRFTIERRSKTTSFDPSTVARLVQRAASFRAAGARADAEKFRAIYGDVPILPPDQYNALALMATDGCRYNRCTFCDFYRQVTFRAKPPDQFARHVRAAVEYHGEGLARRRTIFLGQANALVGDRAWRDAIFRTINHHFEFPPEGARRAAPPWWRGSTRRFAAITSFLDAFTGVQLDAGDFTHLRHLNLRRVFIGMETGDAELLHWLRKPGTPAQILETVHAAKRGGVQVGVIVLLGAGGKRFAHPHVKRTVELIGQMQLGRGDTVYLSPLVTAGRTDYERRARVDGIRPLSPAEVAAQERAIRAGIDRVPTRGGPYVAHYEVAQFVY